MDDNSDLMSVAITDVHMPFWSMVVFMVKWAVATIPALMILILVGVLFGSAVTGFLGGLAGIASHKDTATVTVPPTSGAVDQPASQQYCTENLKATKAGKDLPHPHITPDICERELGAKWWLKKNGSAPEM